MGVLTFLAGQLNFFPPVKFSWCCDYLYFYQKRSWRVDGMSAQHDRKIVLAEELACRLVVNWVSWPGRERDSPGIAGIVQTRS